MANEKIKGAVNDVKGRAKRHRRVDGDTSEQAEGAKDQAKGNLNPLFFI